MGPAGAGSLAMVVNAAMANGARFDRMQRFFAGVGTGATAGIWEERPVDRPEFKAKYAARRIAAAKAAEAVGS
jgi:chlorophyllide a reductase subunit Y